MLFVDAHLAIPDGMGVVFVSWTNTTSLSEFEFKLTSSGVRKCGGFCSRTNSHSSLLVDDRTILSGRSEVGAFSTSTVEVVAVPSLVSPPPAPRLCVERFIADACEDALVADGVYKFKSPAPLLAVAFVESVPRLLVAAALDDTL